MYNFGLTFVASQEFVYVGYQQKTIVKIENSRTTANSNKNRVRLKKTKSRNQPKKLTVKQRTRPNAKRTRTV